MKKALFFIILLIASSQLKAQSEHGANLGLKYNMGNFGFQLGYANYFHPYMGSGHFRSLYGDFEFGMDKGFAFVPKIGWGFSPLLKKTNANTKKIRKHFIEVAVSPGFYFKDSLGIAVRPELGYVFNTPFKAIKGRAAYGYDFGILNREFTHEDNHVFSLKFIYYFRLTGMFI